ncbi:MAG: sugar phosphate isomerase/epimerase family protein [Actinomycetales bacterium]
MAIGLSTYSLFWQWHETADKPMPLAGQLELTRKYGADLLQICDYPALDDLADRDLRQIATTAEGLGLGLELGTRGLHPDHLRSYLRLADVLGVRLVRSMVRADEAAHAPQLLASAIADYERAGVALALETYEQVPTARLIQIVDEIDSPSLGICLDPGNCVAALETPRQTIDLVAHRVLNLHVKDFAFTRQQGWVGFTYAGAKLGQGQLDLEYLLAAVRPDERGINQIVEHWLVWQGDSATTRRVELEWTQHSVQVLQARSRQQAPTPGAQASGTPTHHVTQHSEGARP